MAPLSENPTTPLFAFHYAPERSIAMDKDGQFKEGQRMLTAKLTEYAAREPEMKQIPMTDKRRILYEYKRWIYAELWSKGVIYLDKFGKTAGKPDRFDQAMLQEAFTEIINELEVDL